jgi:hypothetical protein
MNNGMSGLVVDGICANCGKSIRETSPWQWTHYVGEYYCNGRDITDRNYAHPDRETIARAQERHRG